MPSLNKAVLEGRGFRPSFFGKQGFWRSHRCQRTRMAIAHTCYCN
ncbi:hypothetical protein [Scytonema sp. PRP1]